MERNDRRIVIISDTHLGRPGVSAKSPDALRPLWAEADELIVNGDLAELHDPKYRVRAARHVLRLQDICAADGVELTLLSGNHDPFLTDQRHLSLCGGQVFVTHGDALHPAISPWTGSAAELRKFNEKALSMLTEEERAGFIEQFAAAQHASHVKWDKAANEPSRRASRPKRLVEMTRKIASTLWYWHTLPRRAAEFARQHAPEARFFIFGHIHRAGIWTINDIEIINTGCYGFPIKPRAVVIHRGRLKVWPVILAEGGDYSLGNRPLAEFILRADRIHTPQSSLRKAG